METLREKPEVRPGDWITIGARDAVICTVHPEANVEIVYLDRNIAITEDVYWNEGEWKLVRPGVPGENADNLPRLSGYVAILRSACRWSVSIGILTVFVI